MRYNLQKLVPMVLLSVLGLGYTQAADFSVSFPIIKPLSKCDCNIMAQNNTLRPDNPVNCKRLSAIQFSFCSDGGVKTDGKLVVLDVIAPEVAALLDELAKQCFYVKKSKPLEEYNGDDIASMNDNNTSSFNGRRTATSKNWSLHAYGVAIDINPVQNPVIYPNQRQASDGKVVLGEPGTAFVLPAISTNSSNNYVNRNVYRARPDDDGFFRPGMAESVVDLFAYYGFLIWGGDWNDPLDYQHFEVGPRAFIERVYTADPADTVQPLNGRRLFTNYVKTYRQCFASKSSSMPNVSWRRAFCARETIHQFSGE